MTASVPKRVFPLESLDSVGGSIYVNLFMRMLSQGAEVSGLHLTLPYRGHRRARDLPPDLESLGHGLALHGSRSQVASQGRECEEIGPYAAETRGACPGDLNRCIRRSRGRVGWGVFGAVVEIAILARLHARQHLPLGRPIAFEFIRDDHPWHTGQSREQFAEEFLRGVLVPPTLHEDIRMLPS
jgi:hypothetical protein